MIKQQLQADQIAAMKSHETGRLETLRFILSQIKNKEIDTQKEIADEEALAVLKKIKKELDESLASFTQGQRTDLINQTKEQIAVVAAYLPPEISDEELRKEVDMIISQQKDLFQKNKKAVMGICIRQLRSKVDSQRIISLFESL